MKIVGNMTIVGREVGGKADIEYNIDMTANIPHKIEGYMKINGVRVELNAANTPLMSGSVMINGKKIPIGLSQMFINPA